MFYEMIHFMFTIHIYCILVTPEEIFYTDCAVQSNYLIPAEIRCFAQSGTIRVDLAKCCLLLSESSELYSYAHTMQHSSRLLSMRTGSTSYPSNFSAFLYQTDKLMYPDAVWSRSQHTGVLPTMRQDIPMLSAVVPAFVWHLGTDPACRTAMCSLIAGSFSSPSAITFSHWLDYIHSAHPATVFPVQHCWCSPGYTGEHPDLVVN